MTDPGLLDRLRAADPAADQSSALDRALMEAIVASPGDPRLYSSARRRQPPRRRVALMFAVLAAGVGTAWAATGSGPLALFASNPQDDGVPGSVWHQEVVPSTVHRVTEVVIPSVGAIEFWYAETAQHGWCGGLRVPGGDWIARDQGPLNGGGAVPGCQPTREDINAAGDPVLIINGFDYVEGDVDARAEGHGFWRITYGVVDGRRPAVRVTDRVSGRSTPVLEGRLFARAIPDPDPSRPHEIELVARDAFGRIVAQEHGPGG
jgi:hypothetical protein